MGMLTQIHTDKNIDLIVRVTSEIHANYYCAYFKFRNKFVIHMTIIIIEKKTLAA